MDEVINESLQEDASRNRALALYEGTRGDDLVSEEVDERILKLLGLDDIFDIENICKTVKDDYHLIVESDAIKEMKETDSIEVYDL